MEDLIFAYPFFVMSGKDLSFNAFGTTPSFF